MKPRLFRKYIFSSVALMLVCLSIVLVITSFFLHGYIFEDRKKALNTSCLSTSVMLSGTKISDINALNQLHALNSDENIIIFANLEGYAIGCSCDDWFAMSTCDHVGFRIPNSVLYEVQSESYTNTGKFIPSIDKEYIICGSSVYNPYNGSLNGYVFAASPVSYVDNFIATFIKIYLLAVIIPLLIFLAAEFFISYSAARPLLLMSEAAKNMANGDFSKRISVKRKDEIGELAQSFNLLAEALQRTEYTRRSFIANVSHELRTPMTSIGGFIDGIIDGTIKKDETEKYLSIVSNEIKRLSRVVQSMLNLSKLEAGEQHLEPSEFDLSKIVIETVISKEQSVNNKQIEIIGLSSLKKNTIYADYDLIYQVVYNLVDNAVKFINKGGRIIFSINDIDENTVEFTVKNTGDLIKKEDAPYVFERFFKGDKSRAGKKDSTGLGLYIVKTIVELHNGSVFVSVEDNKYTVFSVRIPKKYIPGLKLI